MNITSKFLIVFNIFFLLYYSFQLLVFTDEFALDNLGVFNHAIAGLSEIIGIIFFSLALSLIFIIRNKYIIIVFEDSIWNWKCIYIFKIFIISFFHFYMRI